MKTFRVRTIKIVLAIVGKIAAEQSGMVSNMELRQMFVMSENPIERHKPMIHDVYLDDGRIREPVRLKEEFRDTLQDTVLGLLVLRRTV